MKRSVHPSGVSGTIVAPASKSAAQRAIVAALLARGTSTLRHLTACDDTMAAVGIARALGAVVELTGEGCRVTSGFPAGITSDGERELSCGESGLLARVIVPVAALLPGTTRVNGRGSLLTRPLDMLVDPLRALGATVTTRDGRLPVTVTGRLTGGTATVDGSVSSQSLTGLLMALPLAPRDSTLFARDLKSKPYIDLTLALLRSFGVIVEHDDYRVFTLRGGQAYRAGDYPVEGDWSGASCPLVAGCVAGSVTVTNLDGRSPQADRAILEVARRAGARVAEDAPGCFTATRDDDVARAFDFDAGECPDLFPAIVALAACSRGTSRVAGAGRLTHKESNRALALQREYGKLGIAIRLEGDVMHVTGGEIRGGEVSAHDDHRVAMSLAVAALRAAAPVTIDGADSVSKSYPRFWDDLHRLQTLSR
jgi:3-phosphoshikimate 1-carboxyvinyltransferase